MLMDSMRAYAVELANLLPDRFLFVQNKTWWFIREETWSVMDMRSNTQKHDVRANIWQFLAQLCHEYDVKHITASDNETLEVAAFRTLIEAVKAAMVTR